MINCGVLLKQDEKKVRLPFYDLDDYGFEYTSTYQNKNKVYIGFELEYYIHGCNKRNSSMKEEAAQRVYNKIFDSGLMYFCKSTLDNTCTGEVVLAPISVEYIESDECRDKFQRVLDIIKSERGNVTKKTGGHIHISRTLDNNRAMSMYRFAVDNKEFFKSISGRDKESKWSQFHLYRFRNHSDAINRDNKSTIEYRFWCGSLDYEELKNRAKFCYSMQRLFENRVPSKDEFREYFLSLGLYRDKVLEYF